MEYHGCIGGGSVNAAMKKCPFLHNIAQTHGEEYASSLAGKPVCPVGHGAAHRPVLAEDDSHLGSTFALFHGRDGVLPLPHLAKPKPQVLYPEEPTAMSGADFARPSCPFPAGTPISSLSTIPPPLFAALPMASMSMSWGSNWFNIHHLFQKHVSQQRAQQRKPPQQHQQHNNPSHGGVAGPGHSPGLSGAPAEGVGGKCPLRRALGPLAGIVFNKSGHLACPEPIIKMRAALAATRPVRELRPQALPIKLLALAMTTAALNVPCGMWREHTEKFSSQWFMAVHATIPFIAMLRKAVIMPKYAILFTICAAIAGQSIGAKLERKRLVEQAKQELGGLARATPRVAAPQLQHSMPTATAAAGRSSTSALPVASMLLSAQRLGEMGSGAGAAWGSPAPVATGFGGCNSSDGAGSGSVAGWIARDEAAVAAAAGLGVRSHRVDGGDEVELWRQQQHAQVMQFRMGDRAERQLSCRRLVGETEAKARGLMIGGDRSCELGAAMMPVVAIQPTY